MGKLTPSQPEPIQMLMDTAKMPCTHLYQIITENNQNHSWKQGPLPQPFAAAASEISVRIKMNSIHC